MATDKIQSADPTTHADPPRATGPLSRPLRPAIALVPAGLTFGPLLMAIPTGSMVAYAGALMLGLSLAVLFAVVMRGAANHR